MEFRSPAWQKTMASTAKACDNSKRPPEACHASNWHECSRLAIDPAERAASAAARRRLSKRRRGFSPSAAFTAPPRRTLPTCSASGRRAFTIISHQRRRRWNSSASRASRASSKPPKRLLPGRKALERRLISLIESHLSPLVDRANFVKVFLNERQHLPRESRRRIGRWSRGLERIFEEVIKEGIANGEFRADLDPRLATLAILGMCNAASSWQRKENVGVRGRSPGIRAPGDRRDGQAPHDATKSR